MNITPNLIKKVVHAASFINAYSNRISKDESLKNDLKDSTNIFLFDRRNEVIKDHQLEEGMSHLRAFSINQDYRVIYRERDSDFLFIDVGTHEQVYYR